MNNMAESLKDIDVSLRVIKSLFETGEAKRMYDIAKLFPSKISNSLGINYGRYIDKLSKPEKFTIDELIRFSHLTGTDIRKIFEVILKEATTNISTKQKPHKAVKKVAIKKSSPKSKSK